MRHLLIIVAGLLTFTGCAGPDMNTAVEAIVQATPSIKTQGRATEAPAPTLIPLLPETPMPTATFVSTATPLLPETPTPTATAVPTATSLLPETPMPTATAVPTATSLLIETSMPTATALLTATPLLIETPMPTATSVPTATPLLTETPMPTATAVPTATPIPPRIPTITILSESNFSTDEIRAWTEVATSRLNYTAPDILGVIWSIGTEIGPTGDVGAPFSQYTQVRTSAELSGIADAVDTWVDATGCNTEPWPARENSHLKERIRVWIEGSYEASTAAIPCLESRIPLVGAHSKQSDDTVQKIYLHELYHSLQVSLYEGACKEIETGPSGITEPVTDPIREAKSEAGRWFGEGTAEYFAFAIQSQLKGTNNGVQLMLAEAGKSASESKNINDGGIATTGSAAVRLLVERGVITEDQILNGSLFQACDWVDTFGATLPEIIHAKANWHQLENVGGTWGFTSTALKRP